MAYSTASDLQRIAKSADITKLSQETAANITDAIADADDLIDIQVGGIYIIPLSPVDAMITRISAEIAIYYLYLTYLNLDQAEAKLDGYKRSLDLLKQIREKKITLNAALLENASEQTKSIKETTTRVYTDTQLAKF